MGALRNLTALALGAALASALPAPILMAAPQVPPEEGQQPPAFRCGESRDAASTKACVTTYLQNIAQLSAADRYNLAMDAFSNHLPCFGVSEAKDLVVQEALQAAQELGSFDAAIIATFNRGACYWNDTPPKWQKALASFVPFRNAVAPYVNPTFLDSPEHIRDQAFVFRDAARRYVRFLENADRVDGPRTCGRQPDSCLNDAWALTQRLKARMFHARSLQVLVAKDRSGQLARLLERQFQVGQIKEGRRLGLQFASDGNLATLRDAVAEEARISSQIDINFPEYSRLYASLAPSLDDVRALLRDEETYVSYLFTEDLKKPIAFVVGKRRPAKIVQLPSTSYEIKQLIAAIQEGILDKETDAQLNEKLKLAGLWLIEPLQLAPGAKLIVEADEELLGLPLSLVVDRKGSLGATHQISYVPSAGVFSNLRRSGPGTGTLYVGFGRGEFDPPLRALTAVKDEITAAATGFGPKIGFSDPEASENSIYRHADEVRRARVLHLATHTVYSNNQVGLLFHEGGGEDGLLTETEILARLATPADLVILSGCDTARLDREGGVPGEAFSALTRAFFAVGAKKLLITQWDVDDRFASMIVTYFMRAYTVNGDASRALAEAQRAVREDPAARVKDWAGWVLLSD